MDKDQINDRELGLYVIGIKIGDEHSRILTVPHHSKDGRPDRNYLHVYTSKVAAQLMLNEIIINTNGALGGDLEVCSITPMKALSLTQALIDAKMVSNVGMFSIDDVEEYLMAENGQTKHVIQ